MRGQRNSSMPATEFIRPTARTSVPRMLPPPLKGLEKSRPSATSTSCGSSGGDSHGTQEFHCDGDWKINCSRRSSKGTRTATARSCSQGSDCSRSSPGFPMSSGRPIGCSLKPSNASLSKRPLVAPKNGPQCSASASFAAPPARQKTMKSWPFPLSPSRSVSGYHKQSQQRRMDKSSTSWARRAAEDSTTRKWVYGQGARATSWRDSGLSRGTTLTTLPSSPENYSSRPTSQRSASPSRGMPLPHNALAQLATLRGGATAIAGLAAASHRNLGRLELPSHCSYLASPPSGWSFVKGGPLPGTIWKGKGDVPAWEEIPGTSLSVFLP